MDAKPGFPDRIEVRDLELGETALLLNYTHQPADTPFRSSHAIFVCEGAEVAYEGTNTLPDVLTARPLSLRAFNAEHMMIDADLVNGPEAEPLINRFFEKADVAYIQRMREARLLLSTDRTNVSFTWECLLGLKPDIPRSPLACWKTGTSAALSERELQR